MKQSVNWKSLKGNITVSLIYHVNSRRTVSKEKFANNFGCWMTMQLFLFLPKHTQFKLFVNVGENSFWVSNGT